jgi:hypothetical protein
MADEASEDVLARLFRDREEITSGRRRWGRWGYDPATNHLVLFDAGSGDARPSEAYYVSVADCLTQDSRLNQIAHIAEKPWPSEVVGDFIRALDDVLGLRWNDATLADALRLGGKVN